MNQFQIMDFVVNTNTGKVHAITGLPNNKEEKSVFNLSEFVEIDGIKGMHPHHGNFRYATKPEVLAWVETKFE
ncbi:hypothetical protein DHX103_14345 [Planococcus sp. X10-3]|uniref:hypothetical protein n=1 Tax=Planococcus sp. X10-3 TaxID=3061240 RepID=UPI003BAFE10C